MLRPDFPRSQRLEVELGRESSRKEKVFSCNVTLASLFPCTRPFDSIPVHFKCTQHGQAEDMHNRYRVWLTTTLVIIQGFIRSTSQYGCSSIFECKNDEKLFEKLGTTISDRESSDLAAIYQRMGAFRGAVPTAILVSGKICAITCERAALPRRLSKGDIPRVGEKALHQ